MSLHVFDVPLMDDAERGGLAKLVAASEEVVFRRSREHPERVLVEARMREDLAALESLSGTKGDARGLRTD